MHQHNPLSIPPDRLAPVLEVFARLAGELDNASARIAEHLGDEGIEGPASVALMAIIAYMTAGLRAVEMFLTGWDEEGSDEAEGH